MLPTLSDQTSKSSDPRISTRCQLCRAPYFHPARDGGNHQQTRTDNGNRRHARTVRAPVFIPRPGRRQTPGRNEKDTEARTRSGARKTQTHNDNKHARASSTEDHAAPNPRSRDRAAGQKDQPKTPGAKQKMSTTRGSAMQPTLKNSRDYDTVHACATHGEANVHTLATPPPATHIRTVPKPSLTTRGRTKSNFSTSAGFRAKAAAALQTNEREPRICTPPGTAASPANQDPK